MRAKGDDKLGKQRSREGEEDLMKPKDSQKQRHYFAYKVRIVKDTVFPVVVYRCESWIIKKAECQRTDAFEMWCRRRLLRVLWTTRSSNSQSLRKSALNIHWKDWC